MSARNQRTCACRLPCRRGRPRKEDHRFHHTCGARGRKGWTSRSGQEAPAERQTIGPPTLRDLPGDSCNCNPESAIPMHQGPAQASRNHHRRNWSSLPHHRIPQRKTTPIPQERRTEMNDFSRITTRLNQPCIIVKDAVEVNRHRRKQTKSAGIDGHAPQVQRSR